MPSPRSLFWLLGLVTGLGGLATLFFSDPEGTVLPPKKSWVTETKAPGPAAPVNASDLSGPWGGPVTVLKKVTPTPVVDRHRLLFLGVLVDDHEETTHLFKDLVTGAVLTLTSGKEEQGWTLVSVQTGMFSLKGPGGWYEVSR